MLCMGLFRRALVVMSSLYFRIKKLQDVPNYQSVIFSSRDVIVDEDDVTLRAGGGGEGSGCRGKGEGGGGGGGSGRAGEPGGERGLESIMRQRSAANAERLTTRVSLQNW